jgi:aryl-alcohol dehydrogenase-like predicted oxidoreductase
MARAIRNITARGRREDLVVLLQSYSRSVGLMEAFFIQGLKRLGLERADVLLLGWHNRRPSQKIIDRALAMREKGLFRFLAVSGHNRPLFPQLAGEDLFDIFHVRYNAVHRGAEDEVFNRLAPQDRPGVVTYTATRWGDLLDAGKMPSGENPPRAADCYRFVLSHPQVDVCLSGPRTRAEMREALHALDQGPLPPEEMERLRRIGDHLHAHHRRLFG